MLFLMHGSGSVCCNWSNHGRKHHIWKMRVTTSTKEMRFAFMHYPLLHCKDFFWCACKGVTSFFIQFGYFSFGGSTVICVFEKDAIQFDADLVANSERSLETLVSVGMTLGVSTRNKELQVPVLQKCSLEWWRWFGCPGMDVQSCKLITYRLTVGRMCN